MRQHHFEYILINQKRKKTVKIDILPSFAFVRKLLHFMRTDRKKRKTETKNKKNGKLKKNRKCIINKS